MLIRPGFSSIKHSLGFPQKSLSVLGRVRAGFNQLEGQEDLLVGDRTRTVEDSFGPTGMYGFLNPPRGSLCSINEWGQHFLNDTKMDPISPSPSSPNPWSIDPRWSLFPFTLLRKESRTILRAQSKFIW